MLVRLCEVVPNVEPAGLGAFYLDLTGMASMYGGVDTLADAILSACDQRLSPRLGMGDGKFPAHCAAARADAGDWLRVPDDAAAWLAPLPVSWRLWNGTTRPGWPASASQPWATWRRCPLHH